MGCPPLLFRRSSSRRMVLYNASMLVFGSLGIFSLAMNTFEPTPWTIEMEAKRKLDAHHSWVTDQERAAYQRKIAEAKMHPDKCMSIAIDGTDKFPHGYPHFWEASKAEKEQ